MSEVSPQVIEPKTAFIRYLGYGPGPALGDVPVKEMISLCDAVRDTQLLTPGQQLHTASMELDCAWSRHYQLRDESSEKVAEHVRRANTTLRGLLSYKKTDPDVRLRAEFISAGIMLHAAHMLDTSQMLLGRYDQISTAYGKMAKRVLSIYEKSGDPALVPWMRNLGAIMLMTEIPDAFILPCPGPTRANWTPSPDQDTWFFEAWHMDSQDDLKSFPANVSPHGVPGKYHIHPAALRNNEYGHSTGQGTLAALLDTQKKADLSYGRPAWEPPLTAAQQHATVVFNGIKAGIYQGTYEQTPPDLSQEDARMSELETAYASQEITPQELTELGWLNVDCAIALARDVDRADIGGYLDRAEDVFADTLLKIPEGEQSIRAFEARLANITFPIYRGLLDPAISDRVSYLESVDDRYLAQMREFHGHIAKSLEKLNPRSDQAREMNDLRIMVVASLSITGPTWGSNIAAPATWGERKAADSSQRSCLSIWLVPYEGQPIFGLRGRVQISPVENKTSLDYNILTLPPDILDHQFTPREYVALMDAFGGRQPLNAKQEAYASRLHDRIIASTDLLL